MDCSIFARHNHSTLCESLLVPAMLLLHRGGSRMHFLADWNFRLIPGVGFLYARAEVVTVTRKRAKPRFLNVFKPLYAPAPANAGARQGAFGCRPLPRDLSRRRGQPQSGQAPAWAARLSLETGAPVVPMGICFPGRERERPPFRSAAMELRIGPPLFPSGPRRQRASLSAVSEWHGVIMTEIGRLADKAWPGTGKGDVS